MQCKNLKEDLQDQATMAWPRPDRSLWDRRYILERLEEDLLEDLSGENDEISFLRATVYQLTEKITPSLPPSQEEARIKHRLQFWR